MFPTIEKYSPRKLQFGSEYRAKSHMKEMACLPEASQETHSNSRLVHDAQLSSEIGIFKKEMVTVNSPIKSTLTAVSSQVLAGKIRFQVLPILKSANRRLLYRWGDGPCTDTSVNIPISDFLSLKFITFPFIRC